MRVVGECRAFYGILLGHDDRPRRRGASGPRAGSGGGRETRCARAATPRRARCSKKRCGWPMPAIAATLAAARRERELLRRALLVARRARTKRSRPSCIANWRGAGTVSAMPAVHHHRVDRCAGATRARAAAPRAAAARCRSAARRRPPRSPRRARARSAAGRRRSPARRPRGASASSARAAAGPVGRDEHRHARSAARSAPARRRSARASRRRDRRAPRRAGSCSRRRHAPIAARHHAGRAAARAAASRRSRSRAASCRCRPR